MHEKLNLFIDESSTESRIPSEYNRILNDFSRKQNQSLEAFRSQFEFIDDGNLET